MLDDEGNPLVDEPETPTEKLRRLRYEAEELEEQLEAEAAEKAKMKNNADSLGENDEEEEDEYEQIDDLPRRDDADKTKPPRARRRRKKPQSDENGELSPAVLLKQLKRLRNGLGAIQFSESNPTSEPLANGSSSDGKTKELLHKLSNIRAQTISTETNDHDTTSQPITSTSKASLSQLDSRLDLLEKYVGTNEADVDEVCCTLFKS